MIHINGLNEQQVTLVCLSHALQQLSVINNSTLIEFCGIVTATELSFFTKHLQKTFIRLYNDCSSLKERYLQFQLKWHMHCSYFLVKTNRELSDIGLHPSDHLAEDVVRVRLQWNKVCLAHSVQIEDGKTFLISYCGSVYDEFLRQCRVAIQPTSATEEDFMEESEDVYYRFGGAALASMLKTRYNKMKKSTNANEDQVSLEISILQRISTHEEKEKSHIPDYLKYRDEGFMYFPCKELLPFLRAVDIKTKENVNDNIFSQLGSDMLSEIPTSFTTDVELQSLFTSVLVTKIPEASGLPFKQVDGIFKEMVCKLFHTRTQEFLDSFKQRHASKKGTATLSGQNLRDSLLGHHVQLKSKVQ